MKYRHLLNEVITKRVAKKYVCKLCSEIVVYKWAHVEYAHNKLVDQYFIVAPFGATVTPGNPQ